MNARAPWVAVFALALCACPQPGSTGGVGGGDGGGSVGGGTGGSVGGGTGGSVGGGTGGSVGGGTGGSGGTGGTGGTGGGTTTRTGAFPDISGGSDGRQPMLMIDANGTRHYLYEQLIGQTGSSAIPFRYGECTSNCGVASGWQFTSIGDRGLLGSFGKMALTAQGKPRLIWAKADMNGPTVFYFASCDANCTSAASWTSGPFKTLGSQEYIYENVGRNLAVDSTGRVHLIYSLAGLNYISCASNCTAAASWTAPVKIADFRGRVSLVTTGVGQLKVAYTTQDDPWLAYRTCDANCDTLASWAAETLIRPSNAGQVSLRIDSQGRPRIFFNENSAGTPVTQRTLYTTCDSNCGAGASWTTRTIGLIDGDGRLGLDFELHSGGGVSVAFQTKNSELGLARCQTNCESPSAVWQQVIAEDTDTLKAEVNPPLPSCSNFMPPRTPFAYWFPGEQITVAVHPQNQLLEVAHRTYTLAKCGISGNISEGVTIPRYSGPF